MRLTAKFLFTIFIISLSPQIYSDWIDVYKKGEIELKPDTAFGKNTQWNDLFFRLFHSVIVAPDGSIFISDNRKHRILKFNNRGDLVKSFGQKGEGPGDLLYPKCQTLHGRQLLIAEYASRKRVSVFDVDGQFLKIIKTRRAVFNPLQLDNNSFMYYYFQYKPSKSRNKKDVTAHLVVKDIKTGTEKTVDSCRFISRSLPWGPQGMMSYNNLAGAPVFRKTKSGNILSGFTSNNIIRVLSPEGKVIRKITLNIPLKPVKPQEIESLREQQIEQAQKNSSKKYRQMTLKSLRSHYFVELFDTHHPLYDDIKIDSDGNILVFLKSKRSENKRIKFHVYSPEGKFICESSLVINGLIFSIDERLNNIAFSRHGLFCFAGVPDPEDDEEQQERLIKVLLR